MAKKSAEAVLRCLRAMQEKPPASVQEATERLRDLLHDDDRLTVEPNRFPEAEEGIKISGKWYRVLVGTDTFHLIFPGVVTSLPRARPPNKKQRSVAA